MDYGILDVDFAGVSTKNYPTTSAGGETLALAAAAAAAASSSGTAQSSTIEALMGQLKDLSEMNIAFKNVERSDDPFTGRIKSEDESSGDEAESPGRLQIDEPSVS